MIVDYALYAAGRREQVTSPFQAIRRTQALPDCFVWMDLHEPTFDEFDDVALIFAPHPLAIEDAVNAHQRPKLEVYDDSLFMVLKTLRYDRGSRVVESGEIMLFVGDGFVVTVRHGAEAPLEPVRERLEALPELLRGGPCAVLYGVCDAVVDRYEQIADEIEDDLEELEAKVFAGDVGDDAAQIYGLKREVLELRHAVNPLRQPLQVLADGRLPQVRPETQPYFRDVTDHVLRVSDKADAFDSLLSDILTANLAQITVQQNDDMRRIAELGVQQNEDMRRISAWVALLAVTTVIAGVYGMNFENMPELRSRYGYYVVLGVMAAICLLLYRHFRRSGWL